jgi:S1-C subfamily serine protease
MDLLKSSRCALVAAPQSLYGIGMRRIIGSLIAAAVAGFWSPTAGAWLARPAQWRASVVKIYVTMQREDYAQPWQARGLVSGNGTGFVIAKRRILTNAHVVSDARFLEVQREGDPRKYPARVAFLGHDCDLAVLTVDDPQFFSETLPLAFRDALPNLNDEVIVVGYPMGGARISVTRGVVSRIDHSLYSHSGVDAHLVLQVDAAINPGNSGGPVLFGGKVVGLAFQALLDSQNIGYAIPLPVIQHFLQDIEDGAYHGYPELGVSFMDARNPALRRDLRLADDQTGVVVSYIDPFGSAQARLQPCDVLLRVDGHPVANDGTVVFDGNTLEFTELLERKQRTDEIVCDVWRTGALQRLTIPLDTPDDPFVFRNLYGRQPEYLAIQGLIFTPLTRNYIGSLGGGLGGPDGHMLFYYSQYAKIDRLYTNRTQFVVLAARLAHPVNTYNQGFVHGIVASANERPIGSLRDLESALRHPVEGHQVIRFEGLDHPLVLKADSTAQADREIRERYRLPALAHFEEGSTP